MAKSPGEDPGREPVDPVEYERVAAEDDEAPPAPDPLRPLHPPLPHPRAGRTVLDYARDRDPEAEARQRRRLEEQQRHLDKAPPPMTGLWRHLDGVVPAAVRFVLLVLLVLLVAVVVVAVMMLLRAGP